MLCSDLLLKDMETFKRDYDTYYLKLKNDSYERLYQEALMISISIMKNEATRHSAIPTGITSTRQRCLS